MARRVLRPPVVINTKPLPSSPAAGAIPHESPSRYRSPIAGYGVGAQGALIPNYVLEFRPGELAQSKSGATMRSLFPHAVVCAVRPEILPALGTRGCAEVRARNLQFHR